MKRVISLTFVLAAILIIQTTTVWAGDILEGLPKKIKLKDWNQKEEIRRASGEDLFRVIDGGAEMYLRQGFVRAVFIIFENRDGRTADLQIFEMKDPEGARLVYEQKKGEGGRNLTVGDAARLQDYYLNFRTGEFVVTLVGEDSTDATQKGLEELAGGVVAAWLGD